ncbi:MAG: hypothetical protein LBC02_13770 [Planctomycetaceae bacterium]|nr:hypothetical protein [Planctomycetaceae bacterium]
MGFVRKRITTIAVKNRLRHKSQLILFRQFYAVTALRFVPACHHHSKPSLF